jgi:predicted GNAT family acetyltransferase
MSIKNFLEFINEGASNSRVSAEFKSALEKLGYAYNGFDVRKNGEIVANIRISTLNKEWVNVEMIDIPEKLQRKGIGTEIYQTLLDTALACGYSGIASPAFDETAGTGQQRSPGATALLLSLVNKNGGEIVDISGDEERMEDINLDIEDLKADGGPFYGPPYYDIYIDKSGSVKNKKS